MINSDYINGNPISTEHEVQSLSTHLNSSNPYLQVVISVSCPGPLGRLLRSQSIWHLPSVTREEAEDLLASQEEGTFLVRSSRQPGTQALSLCVQEEVHHFILLR